MNLEMGVIDAPEKQAQPPFCLEPLKANIAVFGAPMSGKTTFVKTFMVQLHRMVKAGKEEIYIIDFGGNMGRYKMLPYVRACFDSSSEENIKRVFKVVQRRMEENAEKLKGEPFPAVYKQNPEGCPPHITFIVENINAFLADERYESYRETLQKLCRDGLSKGLTVLVTGSDPSGVGKILSSFAQKISFSLTGDERVALFGSKVLETMRLPGRGVANVDSKHYEFQCYLPYVESEEKTLAGLGGPDRNRMEPFPKELTENEVPQAVKKRLQNNEILVGLDYYEHEPVSVEYERNRCIGIYGKREFGKTNLLKVILKGLRAKLPNHRFIYVDDGRLQLRRIMKADFPTDKKEAQIQADRELEALKKQGYLKWDEEYYFRDYERFREFVEKCYGIKVNRYLPGINEGLNKQRKPEAEDLIPTVFVVDHPHVYQNNFPFLAELASHLNDMGSILILADIRQVNRDNNDLLRVMLNMVFLLDNIGEFVSDRGSGYKSVFGEMDAKELKSQYAKCQLGDGYCYFPERDDLIKLKFLKANTTAG